MLDFFLKKTDQECFKQANWGGSYLKGAEKQEVEQMDLSSLPFL